MFEIDLPPLITDVATPTERRFTAYAALAFGALIGSAVCVFWIKETASAHRDLKPSVEEMQAGAAGATGATIGLVGMIGGAPFLAMMERAGASEAQILRIVALAQAARSDVDLLTAGSAGRAGEAADAARARIDQAMAEIVSVLTPAQRDRLSGEAIAVPARAEGSGRRFEISRWRGL